MSRSHKFILAALFGALVFGATGGSAQDESGLGDLGIRVRQQNLDAYWLNSKQWMEYGYRPHVTANMTPYTNLPSVFAGKNYYSYGMNNPTVTVRDILGRNSKDEIQMTKYGTWH